MEIACLSAFGFTQGDGITQTKWHLASMHKDAFSRTSDFAPDFIETCPPNGRADEASKVHETAEGGNTAKPARQRRCQPHARETRASAPREALTVRTLDELLNAAPDQRQKGATRNACKPQDDLVGAPSMRAKDGHGESFNSRQF